MIEARHTWLGQWVGRYYAGYRLERAFRPIRLLGDGPQGEGAVLLIANHFSWWDGFIQYRLNREVFKKKFHVMMQEDQLLKYKILRQGGAFSVRKGSRQMLESLRYAAGLLGDARNLVLLFPQGELQSLYVSPFRFQKGLDYLLAQADAPVQLVFNVNLTDYFSRQRPALSVYYRAQEIPGPPYGLRRLEEAFNAYAEECKQRQHQFK